MRPAGSARTASNVVRRATPTCGGRALLRRRPPSTLRGSPLVPLGRRPRPPELRGAYALLLLHYAAAFDQLKERDRHALQMVEVEGAGYAEVGRRLGVGRSNTKMIVFRARQRLRAELSRTLDTAEEGDEVNAVARCA